MTVDLPHGGRGARFHVDVLVDHLRRSRRDHIVIGAQNCLLRDHTKPRSLDYWLRTTVARYPDTGRRCKSLALRH